MHTFSKLFDLNSHLTIYLPDMKRLLTLALVFSTYFGYAQYNVDYGVMVGLSSHLGDIGGPGADPTTIQFSRANPALGFFYRYRMSNLISLKGNLIWGRISGADSLAEDIGRQARNLHFRNDIYELSVTGEIHFLSIKDFGRTGRYNVFFNSYVFLGVGLAYHEPKAEINGEWVNLREFTTEGVDYSNLIPTFPFGLGAHFTFGRKWRLGAELGLRYTGFDYLDDVSTDYSAYSTLSPESQALSYRSNQDFLDENILQDYQKNGPGETSPRGSDESDDMYMFATANLSFMIRGKSNFYRSRYNYARGRKRKRRKSRAKF